MKVINSKNTWYLIFGGLFILIIVIIAFNLIFKKTQNQLKSTSANKRGTLIAQGDSPIAGLTKSDPTPSPELDKKSFFTLFDTPSPTPSTQSTALEDTETVTSNVVIDSETKDETIEATKSGDLKVISKGGVTYLSTENQDDTNDEVSNIENKSSLFEKIIPPTGYSQDIGEYINKMLRFVLIISTLLVFGQLIIGGLQWITSGGDKGKIEAARGKLIAAVIGLIIVASSFAILQLALTFIGYQSLNELMNLL